MIKAPVKNSYDGMIIVEPNLSDADLEKCVSQIESAVKNYGGTILKSDKPYRTKFMHKIKTFKDGFYFNMSFNGPPELPNTLKRTLAITDEVLRYQIVRKENTK